MGAKRLLNGNYGVEHPDGASVATMAAEKAILNDKIIHFLPPRLCYDLYDLIHFIMSIRLIIIADHCCCAMIL